MKSSEVARLPSVPVLKMPVELALPSLRILASHRTMEARRSALTAQRPGVPVRTLLNAYVLPSLSELGLYNGTLRLGDVTRFGRIIAEATDSAAHTLMARRLVELDSERVGLVAWLSERQSKGERKRMALRHFVDERLGVPDSLIPSVLDRLGKWSAYLIHFNVVRENHTRQGITWSVSQRHIDAIRAFNTTGSLRAPKLTQSAQRDHLLEAYARAVRQVGTRLYVPIELIRDELGQELSPVVGTMLDTELDAILRQAPALLTDHVVSFSPFSGPARGGLRIDDMYAGYISIRSRSNDDSVKETSRRSRRR